VLAVAIPARAPALGAVSAGEGREDVVIVVEVQDHAAVRRADPSIAAHHREDELRDR